jgi:hypothetical protein
MRLTVSILLAGLGLAMAPAPAHAEDERTWTVLNTSLEASYLVLELADWSTTMSIVSRIERHIPASETNLLLGHWPSRARVNVYQLTTISLQVTISLLLPTPWREVFQMFTIGLEFYAVANNLTRGYTFTWYW